MSSAERVVFHNVSKRFGAVTAVDNVSFTVEKGSLVTLLGPSGCGKTTTLRMIAGLDSVSDGQILIGDRDVTRLSAVQRDVGMVFQSYALFPHLNILDNVAYGLTASKVPKNEAHQRARDKLALLDLHQLELRLPSELSGGQQQRVAVARALVLEPQVLLFDEPLSNLDAKLRRQVRADIRALQQSLGLTVVYVTHDQSEALAVSDQVIVMSKARISQIGSPRALYETPGNAFIADFIGDSNLISGQLQTQAGQRIFVAHSLRVGLPAAVHLPDGPSCLSVRPNRWRMLQQDTSGDTDSQLISISGTLCKAAYLGSHMEYQVQTEHGELLVMDDDTRTRHSIGAAVLLCVDLQDVSWVSDDGTLKT